MTASGTRSVLLMLAASLGTPAVALAQTGDQTREKPSSKPADPQDNKPAQQDTAEGDGEADAQKPPARPADGEQDQKEIRARELFSAGKALADAKDYATACEKFEESLEYVDGVGTKYNLAGCYENLGQKAKAYRLLKEVAERTRADGDAQRAEVAFARADKLAAELGELRIVVNEPVEGLDVYQVEKSADDERRIPQELLGTAHYVDPGEYEITARAQGKRSWKKAFTLGAGQSLTVVVPELKAPKPKAAPPPAPAGTQEEFGPEDSADRSNSWTWLPPVALGVGAAGLFGGIAFTQQYRASHEDAQAVCPSSYGCSQEEIDLHDELVDDARRARTWAAFSYGVSALGVALAGVYYSGLRSDGATSTAKAFQLTPVAGDGMAGGVLHGAF